MNSAISSAIFILVKFLIGSGVFKEIEEACHRWAEVEIKYITEQNTAGDQRRHGVMRELKIAGIKASESTVRLAIQLVMLKWGKT